MVLYLNNKMNLAGCPDTDAYSEHARMKARRTLCVFVLDGRAI